VERSIESANERLLDSITLSIDIVKQVFFFVLLRYQKAMQCLITMTVSASMNAVSQNAEEVTEFTNSRLQELQDLMGKGLKGINDQVQALNDVLSHLPGMKERTIPTPFMIPGLTDHVNWKLPEGTIRTLSNVKSPNLETVHDQIRLTLSQPFEELKKTLRKEFDFPKLELNISIPRKLANITFCDHFNPEPAVNSLQTHIRNAFISCIVLITIIFLASIVIECLKLKWSHHVELEAVEWIQQKLSSDAMSRMSWSSEELSREFHARVSHPLLFKVFEKTESTFVSRHFGARLKWYLVFVTHKPAWLCIILGIIGYTIIHTQIWIMNMYFGQAIPTLQNLLQVSNQEIERIIQDQIGKVTLDYVTP
jgi:hypothetical protein